MTSLLFRLLDERARPPRQAYPGDAGWDLFALHDYVALPGELTWIRTGVAVAIPEGCYGRIVGRSSAATSGLHVVEGVVDSGYRGEQLGRVIPLFGETGIHIAAGQSVCQLIVQPVTQVEVREVLELPESVRGTAGFGSSGNTSRRKEHADV